MGVRIVGQEEEAQAALYDSVSGLAFGPVFGSKGEAAEFLAFYGEDAPDLRTLTPGAVALHVDRFRTEVYGEDEDDV